MKLSLDRTILLKALAHVQSVVERRNTIPILSNILLDADQGKLRLTATDLDISIIEAFPADVETAGRLTAPAHTLYDIVRKLPDGALVTLAVDGDDGQMKLSAGRSRFTLSTLPPAEFPVIGDDDFAYEFSISADELKGIIDRTRFAISSEETRYYLNGIYLHAVTAEGSSGLRGVATDGHRLARAEVDLPEGAAEIPGVIIPRKTVQELRKLLDDVSGNVQVSLSESKIRFIFDEVSLTSKLIDGAFPDYERVIPSANDKMLKIDKKALFAAADRVSIIASDKSRGIKLKVADNALTLTATSPEAGSAEEVLEGDFPHDMIEIGFNSRYLMDILSQISGDTADISFADGSAPAIIQDQADRSALYVLMPMRV